MQGYFTTKGLALSAKLAAGSVLTISRVVAGSGQTQTTASALSGPCQTLEVNAPTRSGNTAVIPATLAAAEAPGSYTLSELGVYANDPDEGEILYKVYKLSQSVDITAGSSMVLRFYLEETVSQDLDVTVTCSPAGLITEEDFSPVWEKIFATGRTEAVTRTLTAGELQAYLDSLPRLLTGNVTVNVSGTLTEALSLHNFYGPGFLTVQAAENETFTLTKGLKGSNCAVSMILRGFTFTSAEGNTGDVLYFADCGAVYLDTCTVTGSGQDTGISTDRQNQISANSCQFFQLNNVMIVRNNGMVWINCDSADDCHDNQVGAWVWHGGIVLLGGSTPNQLGGSYNKKQGGMIVKADGTLL